MDQELRTKWVAALRSGEYKQTTGNYYNYETFGHCCLDVLAIVDQGLVRPFRRKQSEAKVGGADILTKLMDMNDGGKTFSEIADYIEANL